jgi:hypothetical protein
MPNHANRMQPIPFPMNFPSHDSASRRQPSAGGHGSHVVPVRDVQWGRPVFRPPELPAYPRPSHVVPFKAMRPLRPTRREALEPGA